MRCFWVFLAGIVSVSEPVWATPERLTVSDDRIVAGTQTHLYVLREISDNTGSHYTALSDQHLVEISLDTGEATRFWPLRHIAVSHLDEQGDYRVPGPVTERDGETHDMMAQLRDMGAEPLAPNVWAAEDLTLENGAVLRKGAKVVTPFGLRAAGRAQLAILRDYYPPIETEEEYRKGERIDFYDLYAEGDWLCVLRPEGLGLARAADKLTIAKLHCEDAEFSGAWSFHIIIKDETGN